MDDSTFKFILVVLGAAFLMVFIQWRWSKMTEKLDQRDERRYMREVRAAGRRQDCENDV